MSGQNTFILAKKKALSLIMWGLLLGALSFLFLVYTQKNFKTTTQLLVVQNQSGFTDYYALSRSADFLTSILVQSVYSEKFLDEVNNTGVSTAAFLPSNKVDRLKEWEKMVKITRNPNQGTIDIQVYGNDQNQITQVSNAIVQVLTEKNSLFLGKGQDIEVRILSGPLWEKNPSVTNLGMALAGGFAVGAMLSFMVAYFEEAKKFQMLSSREAYAFQEERMEDLA